MKHRTPTSARGLFRILSLTAITLIPVLSGRLGANIYQPEDVDLWTKLIIEEAFVSRETAQRFREPFGAPEFGWHVRVRGRLVATADLYGTLYIPAPRDAAFSLTLVERDVFADDVVMSLNIEPQDSDLVFGPDRARISREGVEPDRDSGADARAPGIALSHNPTTGTVDFGRGDFTDYYRLPDRPSVVLVIKDSMSGSVDLRPEDGNVHPHDTRLLKRSIILEALAGSRSLRIRSRIGPGTIRYTIIHASGPDHRAALLAGTLRAIPNESSLDDYFAFEDLVGAWNSYDDQELARGCRRVDFENTVERVRIFCAMGLYDAGNEQDRAHIDQRYDHESELYRRLLRRRHTRYQNQTQ